MKVIDLEQHIRRAAKAHRDQANKPQLYNADGSKTSRNWPLCLTCGREVDACNLENVNAKGCEVRCVCYHGDDSPNAVRHEDAIKVTWNMPRHGGVEVDYLEDKNVGWALKRAMRDMCAFDPVHIIGVG